MRAITRRISTCSLVQTHGLLTPAALIQSSMAAGRTDLLSCSLELSGVGIGPLQEVLFPPLTPLYLSVEEMGGGVLHNCP